jgi:hypothetical protein
MRAALNIATPITDQVYSILYKQKKAAVAVRGAAKARGRSPNRRSHGASKAFLSSKPPTLPTRFSISFAEFSE